MALMVSVFMVKWFCCWRRFVYFRHWKFICITSGENTRYLCLNWWLFQNYFWSMNKQQTCINLSHSNEIITQYFCLGSRVVKFINIYSHFFFVWNGILKECMSAVCDGTGCGHWSQYYNNLLSHVKTVGLLQRIPSYFSSLSTYSQATIVICVDGRSVTLALLVL